MQDRTHPWRVMTAVFGGVLVCSFVLQKLFSPAGDAALRAVLRRETTITGTVAQSRSEPRRLALYCGGSVYLIHGQDIAMTYYGHRVRVTGIVHEAEGTVDILTIESADAHKYLDRSPGSQ